jgi:hypothetical protein
MPKFLHPKTKQRKCYYIFEKELWDDIIVMARSQGYSNLSTFCRAAVIKAVFEGKRLSKITEKDLIDRISRGFLVNSIQREYKIPEYMLREALNKSRQMTKKLVAEWRQYLQKVQDEERLKNL